MRQGVPPVLAFLVGSELWQPELAISLAAKLRSQADSEFRLPEFRSDEERENWWNSLPHEDVEVDARLLKTVNTSIRLPVSVIEGYAALSKELGLRSGQTLMKIVLSNYLARHQLRASDEEGDLPGESSSRQSRRRAAS